MSNIQGNRDRYRNRLQSEQSSKEFMNHSSATSSTIMKDSGRRPNLNEQSQDSSSNNSDHRQCAKRNSTTLDTTSECRLIKRLCLPPVSYSTLTKLFDKSSNDILTEMLHSNFRLKEFLNDKRMQERYDWIFSMTKLLEKLTQCIEPRQRIVMIFEQLPNTLYLEGVYDQVRNVDPKTNQLRFQFIELFLKISNKFLSMIPYSANDLTKIVERIELQFTKTKSESDEFKHTNEILNEVLQHIKQIEKRKEISSNTNIQNDTIQPPNYYHQLPIVPNVEELLCQQRTYLRKNIINGIYENAEQYLDIHYRLLREDFLGPLRDGIQQYLYKTERKNFNIRIYENVHSLGPKLTQRNGLVYNLLLDKTVASKINWTNTRRLIYGNLLLLTFDKFCSCIFVTVEDRSQIEKKFIISVKTLNNERNLDKINSSCSLTMIETMTYFEAYRPVLNALKIIPTDYRFPLAEFILKLTNEKIPPDYITPTTTYDFTPLLVDPNSDIKANFIIHKTLTTHQHRFRSSIKPIFTKEFRINYEQSNLVEDKYKKICVLNKDEWPTSEQLHLNPKQYDALKLALTNKVALIQGPPGTGKTFLGVRITEMLLYNRSVWCPSDEQSTPILMICHTNHALDQFLELIVKRLNINQGIIRVGNRSQNSIIQHFSLLNARQLARSNRSIPADIFHQKHKMLNDKTETEQCLKSQQHKLEMSHTNITSLSSFKKYNIIDSSHYKSLLKPYINDDMEKRALLKWLDLDYRFEQMFDDYIDKKNLKTDVSTMEIDDNTEENEEQQRRRNELDMEEYYSLSKDKDERKTKPNDIHPSIQNIIQYSTTLNDKTVQRINPNLWKLTMIQRLNLYRYWLFKYRQYLKNSIGYQSRKYNQAVSVLDEYRQEEDYHILKDNIIVAMTTTCAAKYHTILEKLQSKIVIVEEAAAIFEAHIITALSTKCQHLILIGDHVQLRPNPSVYHLGIKYNIDVSLFERFINNKFPNVRLNIQHRMRPEIARLMKHFYDDLDDHISVKTNRPSVRGIDTNLFFINHNHMETTVDDGSSKRNEFEGKYVIELVQYLIKQDYKPDQITILVMYLGQRQFIAKQAKQKNILRGVRIMVTDNYQGEENDIIILSLVRSNKEKSIGFLKTYNRICVALSRARCGLFVIGNMDLLGEVDEKWKNIITSLSETNHIGKGLPLSCQQHSKNKFLADTPESFSQRPEGGCYEPCDARLDCGHQCELMCHNYDSKHENIVCRKKCSEGLSCGHSCTKRCHVKTADQHDPCHVLVEKTVAECGHQIYIECCETPIANDCKQSSLKKLPCDHTVDVPCRIIPSPYELKRYPCPEPCDQMLSCKHKCTGKCGDCRMGQLHIACGQKCERELICSHVCKAPCAINCPPCSRECQTRCIHSKCKKQCGDLCVPCKEPCAYKCRHLQCTRLCSEPCSCDPCNEPCDEILKCGHTCIGICGEPCPHQCRICDKDIVEEIFFGTEDESNARFVLLPDCKHIIEVTALDQYVKGIVSDKTVIRFPECPRCKQKIFCCTRYMSVVNYVHYLISQVKNKILGNKSKKEINSRRKQLITKYEKIKMNFKEINLDESKIHFFSVLYKENHFFTDDMLNLMKNIILFLNKIDQILIDGRQYLQENLFEDLVYFPLRQIVRYLFKQGSNRNFAEQQLKDIQSELERIRRVIHIEALVSSLKQTPNANEKEGIDSMQNLTKKIGPFTNQDRQEFDDLFKKFQYLNNLPGLGINDDERIAIVSALNMSKGHWYVCPNGHPYVITECGGANQESQCPDCGERIGGQNHHLLETNHHFSLMDNSQHAAWSNEANLLRI